MSEWPDKRGQNRPPKLYRSTDNKMVGGVCSGIAEHFDLDVSVVRLVFLAITLFAGTGIMLYLVAWFVIPGDDGSSGINYAKDQWESNRQDRPGSGRHEQETFDPYRD